MASEGKSSVLMIPMIPMLSPCLRQQSNLGLTGHTGGQMTWLLLFSSVQDPHVLFYLLGTDTNVFLSYKRHWQTFPCCTNIESSRCISFLFSLLYCSFLVSPHLFSFLLFSYSFLSALFMSHYFLYYVD